MKTYTMFVCGICRKESSNCNEIKQCEATHFGLTIGEKVRYDVLKEIVRKKVEP